MSQQAQQTGAAAPDSPLVAVTSTVQKYAIKKKKFLTAEENELFGLAKAAGVTIDQEVFQIVVDLLKMNVAPNAVFQTLKTMCACIKVTESSTESSHTASTTAAPAEVKVRNKPKASQSEKSREPSSHKVQRQPSATRGQKTKSSGSSSSSSQINSS